MHAVKNYKMYKKTNKKLDEIEKLFTFKSKLSIDEIDRVHYLENKCKLLESKYKSPLFELIRNIPEDKETEAIEKNWLNVKWLGLEKQNVKIVIII